MLWPGSSCRLCFVRTCIAIMHSSHTKGVLSCRTQRRHVIVQPQPPAGPMVSMPACPTFVTEWKATSSSTFRASWSEPNTAHFSAQTASWPSFVTVPL